MERKAQAQIITTVLIILLVLAAIVIVWQVIQGTVQSGADELEGQSGCIGLNLDITGVVENTNSDGEIESLDVSVTRRSGGTDGEVAISILIDGAVVTTTVPGGGDNNLKELESQTFNAAITPVVSPAYTKVEAIGKIGDNACDYNAEFP